MCGEGTAVNKYLLNASSARACALASARFWGDESDKGLTSRSQSPVPSAQSCPGPSMRGCQPTRAVQSLSSVLGRQ